MLSIIFWTSSNTVKEHCNNWKMWVKVAKSIHQFFSNAQNIHMLQQLEALGLQLKNEKKQQAGIGGLSGQTFLFTGTLPTLKRSEAEAMAEAKGDHSKWCE